MEDKEKPITLLILDDNPFVLESFVFVLEDRGNFVLPYADGKKLLGDLEETGLDYDVAMIDRSILEVGGDYVMMRLKQAYPDRPVISLSGYDDAKSPYADIHITKPVGSDELEERIRGRLPR